MFTSPLSVEDLFMYLLVKNIWTSFILWSLIYAKNPDV